MRDWSKPQQQSAVALLILGIKISRQMLTIFWPLLLATVFRKKDNPVFFWSIAALAILLFIIGRSVLEFFTFKFNVLNNELIIRQGIFSKKTITIPLEKIQSVHLEQHFWHTLTATTKVLIDTPGSEKTEVAIQALTIADATAFRQMILAGHVVETDIKSTTVSETIVHLQAIDLVKLSLSANHLETLGLIWLFVLARLDDVKRIFKIEAFDWLEAHSETVEFTWQLISAIVVMVLLLAITISIVRTVLRYFNMQVKTNPKGLAIKWGLIQVKQHIIPFNKIQLVEWRTNFIRRKLGLYVVQLKATGENANEKKKQKIVIPTTLKHQTNAIVDCYQQAIPAATAEANRIQKAYVQRRIVMIGLPIAAISTSIAAIWLHWYALFLLLWLGYFVWSIISFQRNFRYWVSEHGLQLYKGIWGRKNMVMNWEKIQFVTKSQSLYQQRKGYANVILHTAGGQVTLPYLTNSEAEDLLDYALYKTETLQKNWM